MEGSLADGFRVSTGLGVGNSEPSSGSTRIITEPSETLRPDLGLPSFSLDSTRMIGDN